MKNNEVILFFDGVCNLCNGFVDFCLNHSSSKSIKFSSLQGETAKEKLPKEKIEDLNTVCLYLNGKVYIKSDAISHLAPYLKFPYNLLSWMRILPRPVRDFGYDYVAKNRYKFFGKKETCRLPTPEEKDLLLP